MLKEIKKFILAVLSAIVVFVSFPVIIVLAILEAIINSIPLMLAIIIFLLIVIIFLT